MTAMQSVVHSFKLPKAGNRREEYEDALKVGPRPWNGSSIWRCAVADGATESPYSGTWARILVNAFNRGQLDSGITQHSLAPLRSCWKQQVPTENLPWYLEEKLSQGSYAAFAGLTFTPSISRSKGIAKLIAVGDCCVMQVRNHRKMRSFPLIRSADFNSRPLLLGTIENSLTTGVVAEVQWRWRTGDSFFLMSDALAAWYLKAWESGTEHRKSLFEIDQSYLEWKKWFANVVAIERGNGNLKNDDIALLAVHLQE